MSARPYWSNRHGRLDCVLYIIVKQCQFFFPTDDLALAVASHSMRCRLVCLKVVQKGVLTLICLWFISSQRDRAADLGSASSDCQSTHCQRRRRQHHLVFPYLDYLLILLLHWSLYLLLPLVKDGRVYVFIQSTSTHRWIHHWWREWRDYRPRTAFADRAHSSVGHSRVYQNRPKGREKEIHYSQAVQILSK